MKLTRAAFFLIVVAGCRSETEPAGEVDAAPASVDAAQLPCDPAADTTYTPVTVSGTTSPGGSLDGFKFAEAGFVSGFCPEGYLVNFTPKAEDAACASAWLQFYIQEPFVAVGTNAANATLVDQELSTGMVTFEATQLDGPDAQPPHITGHFVSQDPAWTFDIAVDLVSQSSTDCL